MEDWFDDRKMEQILHQKPVQLKRGMGFCFISEVFLPYITNTKDIDFFCIGKNKVKKTKTGIIYLKNKILSRQEKYCISVLKEKIINGEIGV